MSNFFRYKIFILVSFCLSFSYTSLAIAKTTNFRLEIIPLSQCADGIDNDSDGSIDFPADSDCSSVLDDDESSGLPECNDGLDNDGDGLIDFPTDFGCASLIDNSEAPSCATLADCNTDSNNTIISDSSNGGGGGVATNPFETSAFISGWAQPGANVILLKDAQELERVRANQNALFRFDIESINRSSFLFSLISIDTDGKRSKLTTIPIEPSSTGVIDKQEIIISPTIQVNSSFVKKGDNILISGQSVPGALIQMEIDNEALIIPRISVQNNGRYAYEINTQDLSFGRYYLKSKVILPDGRESNFGQLKQVDIGIDGSQSIIDSKLIGDFNNDQKVNLVDFSILAFWYRRPSPPEDVDLNSDLTISITDFSILAFYWTG